MNHASYTTLEEEEDLHGSWCSICFLPFSASEADRVPRLLKCGHHFCTECLTNLLDATASTNPEAEPKEATTSLLCPICRTVTRVGGEEAGLPRAFGIIDMISSVAARDRMRAIAEAQRRAELAKAQERLAALEQQRGWLGWLATRDSAAAETGRGIASEDVRGRVAGSPGRLERPVAAAARAVLDDTAGMPATQRTLCSVGEFRSPYGVAVDAEARTIIVTDCIRKQVRLFRAGDGSCVLALAAPDYGLWWPWGVAVDKAAGFIVGTDANRVHVWRAEDGSLFATLGSRGSGPGEFECPRGVAVDGKARRMFVADQLNHRVQVWSTYSSFLGSFGSEGAGPGQFRRPTGLAFDQARGHVIVADSGNHRVQVWCADDCSFVRSFGSRGGGRGQGQFWWPEGVAVDPATGDIVVADWGNHRVQVWSADGTFLRDFGSDGAGPAQFHFPSGVAVDPETGHILVADRGNKRVQVWM